MCVIMASKIKLKNSEKEKWFLYKIRDRAYVPEYKIKYSSKDKIQSGFIVDNSSDWSEGINNKGIMIVNSALQNHEDKKDGKKKVSKGKVSRNGVIIRKALKMPNITEVVDFLIEVRFDGCTLVSDGDKLFVIEIFLQQATKDKIIADLELDPIEDEDKVKDALLKAIEPEDYEVSFKEIKDENLVVRTNHGVLLPKAGYQPKDVEGYESSVFRKDIVQKAIEELNPSHPFEILTMLKNMGNERIHSKDIMRPIRTMPASAYQTTTILCLASTGIMFVLPIECTFEETKFTRIQKDRDVHIVILPKKLPLFEGEGFSELGIIKLLQGKQEEFINIVNEAILYNTNILKRENICPHK